MARTRGHRERAMNDEPQPITYAWILVVSISVGALLSLIWLKSAGLWVLPVGIGIGGLIGFGIIGLMYPNTNFGNGVCCAFVDIWEVIKPRWWGCWWVLPAFAGFLFVVVRCCHIV